MKQHDENDEQSSLALHGVIGSRKSEQSSLAFHTTKVRSGDRGSHEARIVGRKVGLRKTSIIIYQNIIYR
jgi:hypothetical protein